MLTGVHLGADANAAAFLGIRTQRSGDFSGISRSLLKAGEERMTQHSLVRPARNFQHCAFVITSRAVKTAFI